MKKRVIYTGDVAIGDNEPVAMQTMLNSDTSNIKKSLKQINKLCNMGCRIIRLAVQGEEDIRACFKIKEELEKMECRAYLVSDVHFSPKVADDVMEAVDKVRINPGNFPKKLFPRFLERLKAFNKPLRIGVNHGSLPKDILERYGNSPLGMVELGISFIEMCRSLDFHNIIYSMKSSNPLTMISAYHLMEERMRKLGYDYPSHLGVTEAGMSIEGRVKSAVGISYLLLNGIGDTVRISLTEDPIKEIVFLKKFLKIFKEKREYKKIKDIKGKKDAKALFHPSSKDLKSFDMVISEDISYVVKGGRKIPINRKASPYVAYIRSLNIDPNFLKGAELILFDPLKKRIDGCVDLKNILLKNQIEAPVIAFFDYSGDRESIIAKASFELGPLLIDGVIDGIAIKDEKKLLSEDFKKRVTFSILQATGRRILSAEYISCPGCGRTLFDIEKMTESIKKKTSHLKGVKIAVMGCFVNGPGEMADADFGFVGAGRDRVHLYAKNRCVEKGLKLKEAEEKLLKLLKLEKVC